MLRLIEHMAGFDRLTVTERERVLVLRKGRFEAILGAGVHRLNRRNTMREHFDLDHLRFVSSFEDALWRERPELSSEYLTRFEVEPGQVVVVFRDGRPFTVLRPETRVTVWTEAGPWTSKIVDVTEDLVVPRVLAKRLDAISGA